MKVLLIGMGSIGLKHAKILKEITNFDIFALRSNKNSLQNELKIKEYFSWGEVKKLKPDICFICNPTNEHIRTAINCAELGASLFIEKPIGANAEYLIDLLDIVSKRNVTAYVAYNLRFHPLIKDLKLLIDGNKFLHSRVICASYLPRWRSNKNYLENYSARSELGGGVLLDLSHEIDYSSYLFGNIKDISGIVKRVSELTIDVEDFADILLDCTIGTVNLHINYFSHFKQRRIEIDFEDFTVVADLFNNTLSTYKTEELIDQKLYNFDLNLTYKLQIEYFLNNLDKPTLMNNLSEASNLFNKIIEFKEKRCKTFY